MDLGLIEKVIEGIQLLIVEDRVLNANHTLLETRLKEIVLYEISLPFNAGPNPRFQDGRYYLFSHWTINGVLQDPTQYPTVGVTTGTRQRVTAWWRDAGTVWPPVGDGPAVHQITVYAVSAQKGPLLNASDEIPLLSVDPANAWAPTGGRTIDTRETNVALTAKGVLQSTDELFDAWFIPGSKATKSDNVVAMAKAGEGGLWLAFYVPRPKRPFEPPHIYKWPPDLIIHPAGPDPGPMAAVTRLAGLIGDGLLELAGEVELLRRELGRITGQSSGGGEKTAGPSKKKR
jgi:hypothetical protein